MSERAKFISVHGIDGTGKTTLVDNLKTILRARGLVLGDHKILPTDPWSLHKPAFENTPPPERLFYKLGAKAAQGVYIASQIAGGKTVIKDRWVIDVLADETHKGASAPTDTFSSILRPDVAVLLTCAEDVRMERILKRPKPTPDDLVPCSPETRAGYFQDYLVQHVAASAARSITIDCTEVPPMELAREVIEEVYE